MLKIVPAVIATAIIGLISIPSMAQGPRYKQSGNTTVIIVQDDDRYDDRRHPKQYKKVKHGRSYNHPAYRNRRVSHPPLVIVDTRHLPIRRYSNNRYYYRTQAGLHYWLGRNGQLYLDVKFVDRSVCDSREYARWEQGR